MLITLSLSIGLTLNLISMIKLIFILLLSLFILFLMVLLGVTAIGILTGNVGMVEEMMIFFRIPMARKIPI